MDDKKCPFCGSDTEVNPDSGEPFLNCVRPGCVMSKNWTKYGLYRERWNTRPREAELERLRDELLEACNLAAEYLTTIAHDEDNIMAIRNNVWK